MDVQAEDATRVLVSRERPPLRSVYPPAKIKSAYRLKKINRCSPAIN
jgi:hypothetical protein